ncbi:MAG: hypothetical protein NTX22_02800 [Ignavibacteriales bacterium]|nr:hypothetical protein [Ignavibacteriales bacterium]
MKFILLNILIILFIHSILNSRTENMNEYFGKITYQSSQYSYLSFKNTDGLNSGDTLYTISNNTSKPILIIKFVSSRSCAVVILAGAKLKVGEEVTLFKIGPVEIPLQVTELKKSKDSIETAPVLIVENKPENKISKQQISSSFRGRFSVQSYGSLSNISSYVNDQGWRYTFSTDAENINGSGFSLTSYLNFSYRTIEWNRIKDDIWNNIRVYDLAVKYNFDKSMFALFGRNINQKISSLGSIDGVQFQKSFSGIYTGIAVGSRPDYSNFGFDSKLFEVGAYVGYLDTLNSGIMENTFAVFEQTNNFKTDRRFLYFQHNSNIFTDFNFFFSSEVDLYKKENGENKSTLSLTSIYLNSRYSPYRWLSISFSYDARKNVIYYETYKNLATTLFDNETRQGFRLGLSLRPINNIYISLNAGYRFQKNDVTPSRNFGGNITYSYIPIIESSISLSATSLISSYLDGINYGIMIYKDLFSGIISVSGGYSKVVYKYRIGDFKLSQDILSIDISTRIIKSIYLNFSFESTLEKKNTSNRIVADLTYRF